MFRVLRGSGEAKHVPIECFTGAILSRPHDERLIAWCFDLHIPVGFWAGKHLPIEVKVMLVLCTRKHTTQHAKANVFASFFLSPMRL